MCTVCGCTEGTPSTKHSEANDTESHERYADHVQDDCDSHSVLPPPDQRPPLSNDGGVSYNHRWSAHHQAFPSGGAGSAGLRVGSMSRKHIIEIERDILGKNNGIAAVNRALFVADDLLVFNLLSSPGAGKTTLLVRAVSELKRRRPIRSLKATSRPRTMPNVFGRPACQPFKSIPARIAISMLQ